VAALSNLLDPYNPVGCFIAVLKSRGSIPTTINCLRPMGANDMSESCQRNDGCDSDGDSVVAAFASVDFSGVDFDSSAPVEEGLGLSVVDDQEWTKEWASWERETPFLGFASSLALTADDDTMDKGCGSAACRQIFTVVSQLSDWINQGAYQKVLRSPFSMRLFEKQSPSNAADSTLASADSAKHVRHYLRQRVVEIGSESVASCAALELIGIAAFNLYLQSNYTGPSLQEDQLHDVNPHPDLGSMLVPGLYCNSVEEDTTATTTPLSKGNNSMQNAILAELVVDGEWPCPICHTPYFLLVARILLSTLAQTAIHKIDPNTERTASEGMRDWLGDPDSMSAAAPPSIAATSFRAHCARLRGVFVWSARACVAHERLLQARQSTGTLWTEAQHLFEICRASVASDELTAASTVGGNSLSASVIWLEWGLAQHFFDQPGKGRKSFRQAMQHTGLSVEVTGAIGKRTKFQQQSTAQMLVRAKSVSQPSVEPLPTKSIDERNQIKEQMIEHSEEGILLERIKFEQESENAPQDLSILDQAILLALCLDVKNSNPNDCLTAEEMGAYLSRVLDHHDDWMVYSTALLERAWLEFERSHARERAILQMQALADQHTNRLTLTQSTRESIENSAPVQERLKHLHCIVYPPRWSMIEDLAERYASLGIVTSAAELFAEVELWDSVVECYRKAGRLSQAEKIVRVQLELKETPRMWTVLGDLTKDAECYTKALDLSKGRFFDAYLALGEFHFGKGELATAAEYYENALRVRPLIPSAWFRLGTINMQLGQWQEALWSFSEVVLQKPEEAEAWANIAAVHMRNRQPSEAYPALNESLKHMRSNWRVWVSKLYTCLDLEKYDEAIQACNTLLDLREQRKASDGIPALEEKCVRAIVGGTLKRFRQANSDPVALDSSRRTLSRVHTLLDRLTSSSDAEPWVLETMTVFYEQTAQDADKVLDLLTKEYRALQSNLGWEKDNALVVKLCQVVSSMAHIHKSKQGREGLTQSRFALRGVLQKIQAARPEDSSIPSDVKRLESLLIGIDEMLAQSA
jgi:tetratricopeptide (TPR) repeat protein